MSDYFVSDDPALLDLDVIYDFLSTCYWSPGIARERIERAIRHSLCFGVYDRASPRASAGTVPKRPPSQVGFARVVTDYATFAYLCDVFVLEQHRGLGLSKRLVRAALDHPDLRGVRRFALFTRDAHTLYEQFGFRPMDDPTRYMEIVDRVSYKQA